MAKALVEEEAETVRQNENQGNNVPTGYPYCALCRKCALFFPSGFHFTPILPIWITPSSSSFKIKLNCNNHPGKHS